MNKRGLCRDAVTIAVCVCEGVCVSATLVHCVKTNRYLQFFHRRVATPFYSSFSAPNGMAILRREPPPPPNGGVECRWGRHGQKSRLCAYRAYLT